MQQQKTAKWARLIRDEVKAQMKRYAMARTRDEFINSLVDELAPALGHHYRATLGELNRRQDQVEKWRQQEEAFLQQFSLQLLKPTKAKGLNTRKAVDQALTEVMEKDDARRKMETLKFQRTYKLTNLVPLPQGEEQAFAKRVWEVVDELFPE